MTKHVRLHNGEGLAALGICESLLLALTDRNIITEQDARDVLTDVVTTHQGAVIASESPDKHHAVIAIIKRILTGKNGVRH